MSEIRDNSTSEDNLFDSVSIKLTESEPLSSNSYIYIDLEPDEGSRRAVHNRQQGARAMAQPEAENTRQKKAKKKAAGTGAQAAAPRINRGAEPALHVIIEHESPYNDFDYEPEIPETGSPIQGIPRPGIVDSAMPMVPGVVPGASQQYNIGSWQVQQPMQPVQPMQPQAYPAQQLQQQVQPMQPGFPMGAGQQPMRRSSMHQTSAASSLNSAQRVDSHGFVQQYIPENIPAEGKVVRRPWGASAAGTAKPSQSSPVDFNASAAIAGVPGSSTVTIQDGLNGYGVNLNRGHEHRGMMSWKKNSVAAKDLDRAFGSSTVPITVQHDAYQPIERPEVYIAPQRNDAFAMPDASMAAERLAQTEKPKEKPLKINVGTHGKVSTQDHLTISRESIEQLNREQEAKASPIKTISSRGAAQNAKAASTSQRPDMGSVDKAKGSPASVPGKLKGKPEIEDGYIDSFGAPLLDEAAIEESSMFEEPPTSIADGMKAADKNHKKHKKSIVVAVVCIIAAIVVILAVLGLTGQINLNSTIGNIFSHQGSTQQTSGSSSSASGASASSGNRDQSGTVIYEYTATTSEGVDYKVKETVTFSADGNCESTQMEYEFANPADLESLLSNLSRDYGSDYKLISQNGNKATVVIDISEVSIDREAYEDALRYSVDDLMILKK